MTRPACRVGKGIFHNRKEQKNQYQSTMKVRHDSVSISQDRTQKHLEFGYVLIMLDAKIVSTQFFSVSVRLECKNWFLTPTEKMETEYKYLPSFLH